MKYCWSFGILKRRLLWDSFRPCLNHSERFGGMDVRRGFSSLVAAIPSVNRQCNSQTSAAMMIRHGLGTLAARKCLQYQTRTSLRFSKPFFSGSLRSASTSFVFTGSSVTDKKWQEQAEKVQKREKRKLGLLKKRAHEERICALPQHGSIVRNGESKTTLATHEFPTEVGNMLGSTSRSRIPPEKRVFAVVTVAGTQVKVSPGDVVHVNKVEGDAGDTYVFDHVLLIGTETKSFIGRPVITDARVTALIEEQTKDEKIIVLKRRRRKGSSRTMRGHRRKVSFLRIKDIEYAKLDQ